MSSVDLGALRIDQDAAPPPRRPLGPRLLLIAVAALTLALAVTFAWPLLRPARAVRMAPVRTAEATTASSTTATAEAVGWVEADPFPVIVRPLVAGRIQTLDVLEGAVLKAGETVIATLDSAALLAAHDRATTLLAEREAMLARAAAELVLARQRLEQNAEPRLRLREAQVMLAGVATKLATARDNRTRNAAMLRSAKAALTAQQQLEAAGSTFPVALERAAADVAAAEAALAASDAEVRGLDAEHAAVTARLQLAEELVASPVELQNAVAVAENEHQRATAARDSARAELQIAERELGWCRVTAPVDGVVLRLLAMPGDTTGPGMQGLVAVYDPQQLRARIDVPLDSLGGVREGQQVEVRSDAIGDHVVRGVVQRLQHESDLLKNTLQVKVGLLDPPPRLRPETLCRARFLGSTDEAAGDEVVVSSFRVPREAVQGGRVFVFDPARGAARAVPVEVLAEQGADRVVRGELSPTQLVVLDAVQDGDKVTETGR
ncbi:MAG: efflux RND transporter periplasmic adaptor subunit [Planctomycetes bacterium]|nr:efflux RND transporter periplasmic adaptor subunit [Planctomycetota bacterium]